MVYHLQVSTSFWCYLWVDKFHSPRPDRWLEQYIKICIQYQDISWALMRRKDGKSTLSIWKEMDPVKNLDQTSLKVMNPITVLRGWRSYQQVYNLFIISSAGMWNQQSHGVSWSMMNLKQIDGRSCRSIWLVILGLGHHEMIGYHKHEYEDTQERGEEAQVLIVHHLYHTFGGNKRLSG